MAGFISMGSDTTEAPNKDTEYLTYAWRVEYDTRVRLDSERHNHPTLDDIEGNEE